LLSDPVLELSRLVALSLLPELLRLAVLFLLPELLRLAALLLLSELLRLAALLLLPELLRLAVEQTEEDLLGFGTAGGLGAASIMKSWLEVISDAEREPTS
jgi:hypothetical protein